jgi:hypothetical protein
MSRLFVAVATVALLTGATAFAQTSSTASDTKPDTAPASDAPAPDTASGGPKMHKMHGHHMRHDGQSASRKAGSTDWNADKLNACMSNAMPTAQQEECLKQASQS